jgi:hypothetical protein
MKIGRDVVNDVSIFFYLIVLEGEKRGILGRLDE